MLGMCGHALVARPPAHICITAQRVFLLPPLRPLRSLLTGPVSVIPWLRSPQRSQFLLCCRLAPAKRMADMTAKGLSTQPVEFIRTSLLRRLPISSSLRIAYRNTGPMDHLLLPDPRSTGRAQSSSLALCPTFGRSVGHRAPPSVGPFFLRGQTCRLPVVMPIIWTECRCAYCIAHMNSSALLTKRSKSILALSLVKPLRILLPRTRFLRHRTLAESSSLGDGPPVWANPPPLLGPLLAIWLRPYHKAPTSVGASFFALAFLHGRPSDCAVAAPQGWEDIHLTAVLVVPATSKVIGSAEGLRPRPSPRAGLLCLHVLPGKSCRRPHFRPTDH